MSEEKALTCNSEKKESFFIALYKNSFMAVARYISKMGGSFDEAKDVFQDAMVIYYEKAMSGAIDLKTNEKAYLIGISRHLWLRKHHAEAGKVPLDGFDIEMEEDMKPADHKILNLLQTAGKKCMDLLKSFYYDQLPLTDAATLFGFSGVRSATVQKYKCLEKVRETIKEKSLTYEDFLD
jgi:DNA-directed RNA polymerase specialized sigma24 family protein